MDPNTALAELRKAIRELRKLADFSSNDDEIQAGHDVADWAEHLDEWLASGGLLPDEWR